MVLATDELIEEAAVTEFAEPAFVDIYVCCEIPGTELLEVLLSTDGDGNGVVNSAVSGDDNGVVNSVGFGEGNGVVNSAVLGDGNGVVNSVVLVDGNGVVDSAVVGDGNGVVNSAVLSDGNSVVNSAVLVCPRGGVDKSDVMFIIRLEDVVVRGAILEIVWDEPFELYTILV